MQLFSVEPAISTPESLFSPFTREIFLVAFVVAIGLQLWFNFDAKLYLRKRFRARRKQAKPPAFTGVGAPWPELETRAQSVVVKVWAKLPPEILAAAEKIPLLFEEEEIKNDDGLRTLGLYRGFKEGLVSENNGPIILYLRNIEQAFIEDGDEFEKQVRITYLHELGHHLGWSEEEVEARGL